MSPGRRKWRRNALDDDGRRANVPPRRWNQGSWRSGSVVIHGLFFVCSTIVETMRQTHYIGQRDDCYDR